MQEWAVGILNSAMSYHQRPRDISLLLLPYCLMSLINIITEDSLLRFGNIAYVNRKRLRRLWLISPWITSGSGANDHLNFLTDAAAQSKCEVRILTRPPRDKWHTEAVSRLRTQLNPMILYNEYLHAKLYIMTCDGFQCALVGSPNLTKRAMTDNRELAVEFRASQAPWANDIAAIIQELIRYADRIMTESESKLVQ